MEAIPEGGFPISRVFILSSTDLSLSIILPTENLLTIIISVRQEKGLSSAERGSNELRVPAAASELQNEDFLVEFCEREEEVLGSANIVCWELIEYRMQH